MNYRARQHDLQNRRTILWMWCAFCLSLALLIWGVIRTNGDAAIMGLILSTGILWMLRVYHRARADEALMMATLSKFGCFMTYTEIVHQVAGEIDAADILPALARLEEYGLLIGRDDPQLGRMWATPGSVAIPA